MSLPIIQARSLSKRYRLGMLGAGSLRDEIQNWWARLRGTADTGNTKDDYWALRDVSFDIEEGDVVGIIGRNGAGKSTLLKILSRITEPTSGEARIRGRVASLLEVGTGFHPELSGRENIYLNGTILGMTKAEVRAKFDEIVDFSGIEKFIDTPVKRYSSGMYVRLAFAVAAHLDPEILIVDEVLAVGDVEFQNKCLGKMGQIAEGGRTVLFVSHNPQALQRLTTRCVLLKAGLVEADGPTSDVISQYTRAGQSVTPEYHAADEVGRFDCRIRRAAVLTSEPDGVHFWGNKLEFEFDIQVARPSSGHFFSFQIYDENKNAICHFWSDSSDGHWSVAPGTYRLRCTVPKCRLYMGDFTVTTYLSDRTINENLETLPDLVRFRVEMGRIDRRQYDWRKGDCAYLEDHEWARAEPA